MKFKELYLQEGEDKTAIFHKKSGDLTYWTSRNTETTVNAGDVKRAKAIIKKSGVKQSLNIK